MFLIQRDWSFKFTQIKNLTWKYYNAALYLLWKPKPMYQSCKQHYELYYVRTFIYLRSSKSEYKFKSGGSTDSLSFKTVQIPREIASVSPPPIKQFTGCLFLVASSSSYSTLPSASARIQEQKNWSCQLQVVN